MAFSLGQYLILLQRYFSFKKYANQVPYDVMYSSKLLFYYILLKLCSYANTNGIFQCPQSLLDIFLICGKFIWSVLSR